MSCESTVRIAQPEDAGEIWRLFLQGHRENGIFPLAPEKVQWFLNRMLFPQLIPPGDTGPRGAIGVIGQTGALEGIAFILIGNFWYSEEKHLEELLVFVDPQHRKSNHARALVNWMKVQSEVTGIPLLTGIMSNDRTEAKCRLYRRLLPKIGEFFLYTTGKGANMQLATVGSSLTH